MKEFAFEKTYNGLDFVCEKTVRVLVDGVNTIISEKELCEIFDKRIIQVMCDAHQIGDVFKLYSSQIPATKLTL